MSAYHQEHKYVYSATSAIIFLGTPHRGSEMASLGLIASKIASLALIDTNANVLREFHPDSTLFEKIRDEFSMMLKKDAFQIHSFQEARGISGVRGFNGKVCLALHSTVMLAY